jgi:hypothetical protein
MSVSTFYFSDAPFTSTSTDSAIRESSYGNRNTLTRADLGTIIAGVESLAFPSDSSITSCFIPGTAKYLGESVFDSCEHLTLVEFENVNNLEWYIPAYLFVGSVNENLEVIFYLTPNYNSLSSSSLKQMVDNFPPSVNVVYNPNPYSSTYSSTFYYSDAPFTSTSTDSVITPSSYGSKYGTLTRAEIGTSAKAIGYNAFGGFVNVCQNLTSVTIADSVTSFTQDSNSFGLQFTNCRSLTSVTLSNSLQSLPSSCFFGSTSLQSILIPNSVTSFTTDINNNFGSQFENCTSLTSVTLSNSLISLPSRCFSTCTSLSSITIPDSVTSFTTDGNNEGGQFRYCRSLTSVTLSNQLQKLSSYCFRECTSLSSITIPDSVTSLGAACFYNTSSLESIIIPDSVTEFEEIFILDLFFRMVGSQFEKCTSLISAIFVNPNNLRSAGSNVFTNTNSALVTTWYETANAAALNPSGTKVYNSLTAGQKSQAVFIPGPYPEPSTFYYSDSPFTSTSTDATITSDSYGNRSTLTRADLGTSATAIGPIAFFLRSNLTSVTMPNSVTSFTTNINNEGSQFVLCTSLTSVTLSDSLQSLPSYCFSDCTSLQSILIPNSVTTFTTNTFSQGRQFENCSSLTSVTLSNSLQSLPNFCFFCCTSLPSISIPNSVTSFTTRSSDNKGSQFDFCTSLTSVTLSDSLQSLPGDCFNNCTSLPSITIPSSVISIEDNAFSYCSSLTTVNWVPVPTRMMRPNRNVRLLRGITGSTIESLGANAFLGSGLTSFFIPETVTSIGNNCFDTCSNLVLVEFEDANNLLSVGTDIFANPNTNLVIIFYLTEPPGDTLPPDVQNMIDNLPPSVSVVYDPNPACFGEGTKILIMNENGEQEYREIENLKPGDQVQTYAHGLKKISRIGSGKFMNDPDVAENCMYMMKKRENMESDLMLTGGHSVLVNELDKETMIKQIREWNIPGRIDDKYMLVTALNNDFEKIEERKVFNYWHICLEGNRRYGVYANGILCETVSEAMFSRLDFDKTF